MAPAATIEIADGASAPTAPDPPPYLRSAGVLRNTIGLS